MSHGDGKGVSIVGVFDGHGGKRCSRYAAQHLPENFYAALGEMHSRAKTDDDKENLMGSGFLSPFNPLRQTVCLDVSLSLSCSVSRMCSRRIKKGVRLDDEVP